MEYWIGEGQSGSWQLAVGSKQKPVTNDKNKP
jgi:hypothetical protein